MTLIQKFENWLRKILWHKSDSPKTLEQKVYFARNAIIASCLITIFAIVPLFILKKFQLLLLAAPMVLAPSTTAGLLIVIKRGIKWFLHIYYGGYIIICCVIVLILGGLPNSMGIWGGAFIVFMHSLAIKDKKILVVNAFIYFSGLVLIALLYPYLTPFKGWDPKINNLLFYIDEIWMCLFVVKAFYDSIVVKTNEAKQKAEHLQELDVLKSKLYANITHEFRTPLTLIKGNAEEIGELHGGETSEKIRNIIQCSDKFLFLVNQMLSLSKLEEGNVALHYTQSDLVAFIRFIVGSFQGYAEMRKIRLHFEPQCPRIMMDIESEKLEGSISNLLSNAIKYTRDGGDVFVTVRKLNPPKTTEQFVEISVRDTGIGIPENQLDKIFIRFFRIEDKRYPYHEGTGIGLTLVNEYLKLMKGSINVKSCVDKGSEFTVTLPVTNRAKIEEIVPVINKVIQTEEITASEFATIECIPDRPRLMIVEDNRELRDYLIRLLENEYQIIISENGLQGVEQATEYIPDIILSDVMMPGKDGFQLCSTLKNDIRTSHIPIVLLTARADSDSRISGMEQGADAYLTKPFNKKELIICLHNLLVQRETLRLKFSSTLFDKKPGENDAGLEDNFLGRVISYLERNYKNDMYGIHNLYSDMNISRVQLHRKLIALTGQSTSNFIRNFRLQKARTMLMETNMNVSDIAFKVGFADANYFSRSFLHEFGMTATKLRKSFRPAM
jgi:signal transduction histidine kinase/DNA-binding response OmpR family regulator